MKRNSKGFTLIELLIVVAIIGIIVAIAIPNLLNAIQRAKQRRSMGDIRTTATAIEAYAVDLNRYPPAAGYTIPTGIAPTATLGTLSTYVSPTYVKQVPLSDGWNSWFLGSTDSSGSLYVLASAGRDGKTTGLTAGASLVGPTTDFNSDIVYVNGSFVQWPEGVQR
jgi:general secretion pathway protein G